MRVEVPSCVTPCIALAISATCSGLSGSGARASPDTGIATWLTTLRISRTSRGSKRWPPDTSVAVALASCSMVKLL